MQYRMHQAIMAFSSEEFYGGELVAAPQIRGHRLCDLPGLRAQPFTEEALHFMDTAGLLASTSSASRLA